MGNASNNNWDDIMQEAATHYAKTAMQPGWWQWARHEVAALESAPDSPWVGIKAMVVRIIKDTGYMPSEKEFEV